MHHPASGHQPDGARPLPEASTEVRSGSVDPHQQQPTYTPGHATPPGYGPPAAPPPPGYPPQPWPQQAPPQAPPPAPAPKKPTRGTQAIGVLFLIALVVLCGTFIPSLVNRSSEPTAPTQADIDADAIRVCEDFTKKQLKAPSTAKFSGEAVSHSGDSYAVTGDVDSQNSFGAMLRNRYICTVTASGDRWINGQVRFLNQS